MGDYYILTRRGSPAGEAVEFYAGPHGDERTTVVFTSRDCARRFAAGWAGAETNDIQRLDEIGLLSRLIDLFRSGVQRVALDPERSPGPAMRQPSCSLPLLLGDLAGTLRERLHGCTAAAEQAAADALVAFRCERCQKVRRQLSHQHRPACCGTPMQIISERGTPERLAMGQR